MRRDVKMGFGVGGVLLAVIIVAVLVVHRNQNKQEVRIETTGTTAPGVDVTPPPDAAKPTDPTPAPITDPAKPPEHKEPAHADDKWEALFASSTTEQPKSRIERGAPAKAKPAPTPDSSSDQTTQDNSSRSSDSTSSHSTDSARTHTVQAGETLSGIAMAAYGDSRQYKAILAANPGLDAARLRPGMVVKLPPLSKAKPAGKESSTSDAASANGGATSDGKTYTVKPSDSLYAIAKKLYGSGSRQEEIYNLNKQLIGNDSTKLKPGMVLKLPAAPAQH